ncbi:DUF397 domain-containing protein [Streptosporangium amethystogenes]|uniref:DUF397 domain-containing protein n=1 Tax=Streptosporangium amethystogenes TaxID=2002 RepID=UPI0004C4854E|nr:DUF397 domain-containing protein [Streptosporangium amethystogenes]
MISPDLSAAEFHKSSFSGGGNGSCVEVAINLPGLVAVRDSKDRPGPVLSFAPAVWRSFLDDIRAGNI